MPGLRRGGGAGKMQANLSQRYLPGPRDYELLGVLAPRPRETKLRIVRSGNADYNQASIFSGLHWHRIAKSEIRWSVSTKSADSLKDRHGLMKTNLRFILFVVCIPPLAGFAQGRGPGGNFTITKNLIPGPQFAHAARNNTRRTSVTAERLRFRTWNLFGILGFGAWSF